MQRIFRAIIVEDEILGRERLRKLLTPYSDRIEIIGEACDGEEGLALAESIKPDVVFLDIQMPVMDGFEMLQNLSYQPFVIFTTAYDVYAIRAFEENSIDYLLKPIEKERLDRSLKKLESFTSDSHSADIQRLLQKLNEEHLRSIPVSKGNKIIFIRLENIVCLQAEDKYVFIHDTMGEKHLLSTTLKELEQKLDESFIRIHRACIINLGQVKEIQKSYNGKLNFRMAGKIEMQLSSSQSYTPIIKKLLRL